MLKPWMPWYTCSRSQSRCRERNKENSLSGRKHIRCLGRKGILGWQAFHPLLSCSTCPLLLSTAGSPPPFLAAPSWPRAQALCVIIMETLSIHGACLLPLYSLREFELAQTPFRVWPGKISWLTTQGYPRRYFQERILHCQATSPPAPMLKKVILPVLHSLVDLGILTCVWVGWIHLESYREQVNYVKQGLVRNFVWKGWRRIPVIG